MNDCYCTGPGLCQKRGCVVTKIGHRICSQSDPDSIRAYFGIGGNAKRAAVVRASKNTRAQPCVWLGPPVMANGVQVLRECRTCQGNVRLKVSGCNHPGHAAEPTTTSKECERCSDYQSVAVASQVADG